MDDAYKQLPFDQLRTLHREIGALIAERRVDELDRIRAQISVLGFSAEDLAPKNNGKAKLRPKYRDPENGATWSGKGARPQWLRDALEGGRQLEEFLIA